ncbi:head-tail connector protein [Pseudovibrio sp. SPO723]|uniref:head-tail connector protein n=1 Tax=Nesiotobacter zosterae TaxID=392721 RepID=UPI0029C5A9C3|nr:phage head-tail connector protein [Pseudovibrio sp. SPO723]MDX5595650.1 phage head-tail connector protein [Pseudovibrio sp. SPO723]
MKSEHKPSRMGAAPRLPITLEEAKAHLVVDFNDDDGLILAYMQAAVDQLDGYEGALNRCLLNQTWREVYRDWPVDRELELWFGDVSAVTVTFLDQSGVEHVIDEACYELLEGFGRSFIRFLPTFTEPLLSKDTTTPVRVEYVTGFGDLPENVPAAIRYGALMIVGSYYANREDLVVGSQASTLPRSTELMIKRYRRFVV